MFDSITVYVPTSKFTNPDVRDGVNTLRWIAGGMGMSEIDGSWISETDGLVVEKVTKFEYMLEEGTPKRAQFGITLGNLIDTLKATGEESVLVTTVKIFAAFN